MLKTYQTKLFKTKGIPNNIINSINHYLLYYKLYIIFNKYDISNFILLTNMQISIYSLRFNIVRDCLQKL